LKQCGVKEDEFWVQLFSAWYFKDVGEILLVGVVPKTEE